MQCLSFIYSVYSDDDESDDDDDISDDDQDDDDDDHNTAEFPQKFCPPKGSWRMTDFWDHKKNFFARFACHQCMFYTRSTKNQPLKYCLPSSLHPLASKLLRLAVSRTSKFCPPNASPSILQCCPGHEYIAYIVNFMIISCMLDIW